MFESVIYVYGFLAYCFDKLMGKNNIARCSKCKNFYYTVGLSYYYDHVICTSCLLKSYRNISNIQYDEEEDAKIKNILD